MDDSAKIRALSPAHCILLATSLASDSDIHGLRSLVHLRHDILVQSLVLRILLAFLPESLEPAAYTNFLLELHKGNIVGQDEDSLPDYSSVIQFSQQEAEHKVKKQHLLQLRPSHTPISSLRDALDDPLVLFLIHRAHQIDARTGLLTLLPSLISPFLEYSTYLRDWFISTVLPLLRLDYEYYNDQESRSLLSFENLYGLDGISLLVSKSEKASRQHNASPETIGRDLRGIVGPWTYGSSQRKRRKLQHKPLSQDLEIELEKSLSKKDGDILICQVDECGKIWKSKGKWRDHMNEQHPEAIDAFSGGRSHLTHQTSFPKAAYDLDSEHASGDWQILFQWLVKSAVTDFPLVVHAYEHWDGPSDVDFGGYLENQTDGPDDSAKGLELRRQYCQAAFASVYATNKDDAKSVEGAHSILVRLAELLGFEPPPNLATSIMLLPRIDQHAELLNDLPTSFFQLESLLHPKQPLTTPKLETFSLLQILVYSAYQLRSLGTNKSIMKVAKLRFWSDESEQLDVVRQIMSNLASDKTIDDQKWVYNRDIVLWLWNWGMVEGTKSQEYGQGLFGKVSRKALETEILKVFCKTGQFSLIAHLYIDTDASKQILTMSEVEKIITDTAYEFYDAASNGNKTRGSMKKASSLVSSFNSRFPHSDSLARLGSLISATHSLSYYSLTLQQGVPLKPEDLRKSDDPLSLITKVLEQNPRSYTKLDDLITIGQNLANTLPALSNEFLKSPQVDNETSRELVTERRVIGMAIDAALTEDDFETAYSYVVNRLTPPAPDEKDDQEVEDDFSWRAAWQAGKYRSTHAPKAATRETPQVRRLEQRMELLSQALLLAPPAALAEVLAAWRRCEEELLTLLIREADEERAFDEKYSSNGNLDVPGGFGGAQPAYSIQARRKEVGRGATEEAPVGLFDVAKGAAAAFGRTAGGAFTDRRKASKLRHDPRTEDHAEMIETGGDRVRKRDMVANAVTGGLASGIGWVLGAQPVDSPHE